MKISAVILTKNSEGLIDECLKSVSFAQEIIVLDEYSTDKTKEKASKHKNTKVFDAPKDFSKKRNLGLKKAKHEWILYVDVDERVTPELEKEILKISDDCSYAIPRKNIIFKKEFKHTGQYPDYVKRLFKKENLIKWTGELHEEPVFKGKLKHLKSPLIHKNHNSLEDMVLKTNEWSQIEAELMYKAKHPKMNVFRFFSAMFREFFLRMIKQMAFLDGVEGIIYAIYQVFSRSISYAKLWEMQIKNKK